MKGIVQFFGRIKFVTISMILAGVVIGLIVVPRIHCSPWFELLFHFGETLVIAGLVGLLLEVTEFAQYFEERLSTILVEEKFLALFTYDKLKSISASALRQGIGKQITNPASRWQDYFSVVLEEILPLFTRTYRANYREVIRMSLVDSSSLNVAAGSKVSQMETVYEYDVVSPLGSIPAPYKIQSHVLLNRIPGLDDATKYYSAGLTINDKVIDLKGKLEYSSTSETIEARFSHDFDVIAKAHVRIHLVENEFAPGPSGFISARMQDLTHKATLVFSSEQPLTLDSTAYGLGTQNITPDVKTKNTVVFIYSGWMLPGEGFFVDWVSI